MDLQVAQRVLAYVPSLKKALVHLYRLLINCGRKRCRMESFSANLIKMSSNCNMRIVLYQPDIPQNMGSLIRLAACMGIPLSIIEPCGFAFDDRRLKRVAMDYHAHADITRHSSWNAFNAWRGEQR